MRIARHRNRRCPTNGFGLIEVLIVLCIISILGCMAVPAFARARAQTRETLCIHNLQRIEQAKALWYSDNGGDPHQVISVEALQQYFQNGDFPVCPEGGDYEVGSMEQVCECSLGLAGHILTPLTTEHSKDPKKPKPDKPGTPPHPPNPHQPSEPSNAPE